MNDCKLVELTVCVLDYRKEKETRVCLESIRRHVKFDHKIVYLDNGSNQDYPWKIYQEGLCDILISKKNGGGGGEGQTDLFRWVTSPYTLFVQNDQELVYDITPQIFAQFIHLLNNGYDAIGLNGDQSNRGVWTDRAHLIKTDFFNSLGPFPNGGPGEKHHIPWNEKYLQDKFDQNGYKIAQIQPVFFRDRGSSSTRRNPDGSVWEHRPDTKELRLIKGPIKERYVYPKFNDAEWQSVLSTQAWKDWDIPENEKNQSFHVWN